MGDRKEESAVNDKYASSEYIVFARATWEDTASRRGTLGAEADALSLALRIARATGEEGALSVWVETAEGVVTWAAGEKATELGWADSRPPGVFHEDRGFAPGVSGDR